MNRLGEWICRNFHPYYKLTRPVNGHTTCLVCMRRFAVSWGRKGVVSIVRKQSVVRPLESNPFSQEPGGAGNLGRNWPGAVG